MPKAKSGQGKDPTAFNISIKLALLQVRLSVPSFARLYRGHE